ncbi:Uu.00g030660.m01.CDS01 [Anthostomella pinea]|uniref:Uu.00g030660.m01.CDS01 n=1 Tax=Anthostomella pinea TaxID=933095 RepID=A0AAI8V3G7_9PEZI|nr:Uu.00g030660.m01.CDS01 [Anthostomella pinea]
MTCCSLVTIEASRSTESINNYQRPTSNAIGKMDQTDSTVCGEPEERRHQPKRQRIVEGSCWPCKQRRVKCDLQKSSCRRCVLSGTQCSYDKLVLRWRGRPTRTAPFLQQVFSDVADGSGTPLATNERRALDYFKARLWPLLSTADRPCSPPISLALRSRPVLQAACIFAESHRALQERGQSREALMSRRLNCMASIRGQLGSDSAERQMLDCLLVAVLLLYLLDGFVDCNQQHASTQAHYAGVLAILDALGGFESAWKSSERETCMLLSEFASTDLTDALLQGRKPCFPPTIWQQIQSGPVWWQTTSQGTRSLASVLGTMAEMAFYSQDIRDGQELCRDKVVEFERALQPTYSILESDTFMEKELVRASDPARMPEVFANAFVRAFQHAGLIYLYRVICNLPTRHLLLQQHVHACLDCIQGIDLNCKAQNCALFPLYVAGAHSLSKVHRDCVLLRLDGIYAALRFEAVLSIRAALESLWKSERQLETWSSAFQDLAVGTLVL